MMMLLMIYTLTPPVPPLSPPLPPLTPLTHTHITPPPPLDQGGPESDEMDYVPSANPSMVVYDGKTPQLAEESRIVFDERQVVVVVSVSPY